jgi:hypothetical protein
MACKRRALVDAVTKGEVPLSVFFYLAVPKFILVSEGKTVRGKISKYY